jgi:cell division protein FtsQ
MIVDTRRVRRISNNSVFYIAAASLLIILFTILGTSVFLKVIVIEVSGAEKYSDADIIRMSGIQVGENILRVDVDAAARKVELAMPYIEEANIMFKLPDKILIEVKESVVIGAIDYASGVAIVNPLGKVLDYIDFIPQNSIVILGFTPAEVNVGSQLRVSPEDDTKMRHLLEVLRAIEETKLYESIDYIDITNISRISIGYQNRLSVVIGTSSEALSKLSVLTERIRQLEADPDYDPIFWYRIDTTDPTGTWRSSPEGMLN